MKKNQTTKSKFLKVKCEKCKNEQNIFSNVSTKVDCLVCNEPLAIPTGGKAKILSKTHEVLE